MSDILSSYLENDSIYKRNKSSSKIKKIILTKNLKSAKVSLSQSNLKNLYQNNSRQNLDKIMRKVKPTQLYKYTFIKDYKKLSNDYNANSRENSFKNVNSFNSPYNINTFISTPTKNFFSDDTNIDSTQNNNDSNVKNISTDFTNNKNIKGYRTNRILLPIKQFNSYEKINSNKNNRQMEINKILNSLTNNTNNNNMNKLLLYNKKEKKKSEFPMEKMIDPKHYIKYNLLKNPMDKSLYKGINSFMKENGDNEITNLLKRAKAINARRAAIGRLDVPESGNNIYKKKYEDMISQTKNYESFHFNKNKLTYNKLRKYNPYQNILDRTYKIYINNNFPNLRQKRDFNFIEANKNQTKLDTNFEKNIDKYISFDTRVNNILKLSKHTENNVNQKSKEHEIMINRINQLYDSY